MAFLKEADSLLSIVLCICNNILNTCAESGLDSKRILVAYADYLRNGGMDTTKSASTHLSHDSLNATLIALHILLKVCEHIKARFLIMLLISQLSFLLLKLFELFKSLLSKELDT